MSEFVWPSDSHRAENRELDYVCDYLGDTLDKLDALRATNSDLLALYESTRVELGKARAPVAELKRDVAKLEALRAPVILRKQAEAVEQCWTDIADMASSADVLTPEVAFFKAARYCADYSLRLRQQAEAAERTGGEK